MPRKYQRRSKRGEISKETLEKASQLINRGESVRKAAQLFDIPRTTLRNYISRSKPTVGYSKHRMFFSEEQEQEMARYLIDASNIYFGLTVMDFRKFAYACVEYYKIRCPDSWHKEKIAGIDWYLGFMNRHGELSIRRPESTSIGRASAFNKENVKLFFSKLADVMDRHQFEASCIWNVDESGVTTVASHQPKILAERGARNVCSITSAERGELVTLCTGVSACGQVIPPFFVFPRVHFRNFFLSGAPASSAGGAHRSGWMTAELFLLFMKHFCKFARPSSDHPVLLLLDNHESHVDFDVVKFCKENGVILLSFPPHCSHKLQPLDVSVFGPLKSRIAKAQQHWMRSNPGRPISIYNIPGIVNEAWNETMSVGNVTAGFRKTGIFPFNADTFCESDFSPSSVTDRPVENIENQEHEASSHQPEALSHQPQASSHQPEASSNQSQASSHQPQALSYQPQASSHQSQSSSHQEPQASRHQSQSSSHQKPQASRHQSQSSSHQEPQTSSHQSQSSSHQEPQASSHQPHASSHQPQASSHQKLQPSSHQSQAIDCTAIAFSPTHVRPHPKANARVQKSTKRKRKTAILTDSPEMEEIAQKKKQKPPNQRKKERVIKRKENSKMKDKNWLCIICLTSWLTSPHETWVQCTKCHDWAHENCIGENSKFYVCHNCDSDDSEFIN